MKEFVDLSNQFKPRGKIKVELFDDLTGRKVEEIKTENFIAKGMDYFYRLAMISIFTDGRHTGGVNLYDSFYDQFEYMMLTDANHAEDPLNEWLVKGRQIGFAYTDRTYSGSNEHQGSYNANESFTNNEQVHIVIDFPTHAANGTFQSIYFLYDGTIFRPSYDFFDKPFGDIRSVQKYTGDFYTLSSNGFYFRRYDENFNLLEQWTLQNSSSLYNIDFVVYNGDIYIANYYDYYPYHGIWKVPLSEPDSEDIEQVYDGRCYGITHDGTYFYVSTYDYEIIQFDSNFNIVEIYEPKTYDGSTVRDRMYTDTDGTILLGNYVWDKGNNLVYTGGINLVGIIDDDKIIGYSSQLVSKKGFSSRALLDSPVTKTSNNTMKITYDFMLPSLFE